MVLAALLAVTVLGGCGEQTDVLKDMKVEKYVTLGEYVGIPVELAAAVVDEAQEAELMRALYMDSVSAELGGITDREVVLGDTVNIDYVGTKDDVAFAGGTARGALLEIGSGQFIEGFEEGLIGVMPGETVKLDLRFPDGYRNNAELAGQAVVFTVTVNFIIPEEYSDDVIAGLGIPDITTVADMQQFVHEYLEADAQNTYEMAREKALVDNLIDSCVFQEIPEVLIEKYRNNVRSGLEASCAAQGIDIETYCLYSYGMDAETFLTQYVDKVARQGLALQAVANAENLNISDEELQEKLEEYAAQSGYDNVEDFLGEVDREEYREYFMLERVLDFLIQNAQITEY